MAATWDLAPLERAVVEPPSSVDIVGAAEAEAAAIRERAFADGFAAVGCVMDLDAGVGTLDADFQSILESPGGGFQSIDFGDHASADVD